MNSADWLLTVAQIAMTLTGFASLLAAFRFSKRSWQRVELHAIRFLIKSSVGAFVFALLPLPMIVGGMEAARLWAYCFAALGLWTLIMVVGAFRARYIGDLKPRFELGFWGLTLSGLAIGIVELTAVVDGFSLRQPAIYLIGLYWLLAVAVFQLIMQVMAVLRSIDPD